MKKKIVITGISSTILKNFALQIDASLYDIIGISRTTNLDLPKSIKVIQANLEETYDFSILLQDCDIFIHGAALTHSKKAIDYNKINFEVTKKIVDCSIANKVKHFVFISSNTAGELSGAYGFSKLLAENYIKENLNDWSILRLSEVYGVNKNEGIEKLLKKCIKSSYVICPSGVPSKLYPIHLNDAIRLLDNSIFRENSANKIVTLNGSMGYTIKDIVNLTATITKRNIKIINVNRKTMFFLKKIIEKLPFKIGIVPDQIDRLYAVKSVDKNHNMLFLLEDYIKELIDE